MGTAVVSSWQGPDAIKKCRHVSHDSPEWRDQLVEEARWILILPDPDAIVLDESFTAWGRDHHEGHGG